MAPLSTDLAAEEVATSLPLGWRIASWLATVAGVLILGYVIALWGWRWLGPPPAQVLPPPEAERWTPAIVAAPIFGRAGAPQAVEAASPTTLQGDTRLLGVFAETGGTGYA